MIQTLRFLAIALALIAYFAFGWVAGLVVLAVVVVTLAARYVTLQRVVHGELRCELGHVVPTYGLYTCSACHFTTASWVWRCPNCASSFGHARCPTCGRSVANPLMRGRPWG